MSDHDPEQAEGPWLNYTKAADHVSLPESSLRKLVMRREIPFRKVGKRVLFSVSELDAWVSSNPLPLSDDASAA